MTGSGTLADPFVIWDVNDLQLMNSDAAHLAAYYELANDIDASATIGWNGGLGFIPVGSWPAPAVPFTGHFDGKGYVISELHIHRIPAAYDAFLGLFGYTLNSGEIKNVGLVDCNITGGYEWIGALVGYHDASGKISNCYSTGIIEGGTSTGGLLGYVEAEVEDCWSSCAITAESITINDDVNEIGGLIGQDCSLGTVRCYATGNVTCIATGNGDVFNIGGLVGLGSSIAELSQCFATGNIHITSAHWAYMIGGLVGVSSYHTKNCYARGNITVNVIDPTQGWIGGFQGYNDITIENCYSTGLITPTVGQPNVGGFCGENWVPGGGVITGCFWDTETSGMLVSDGGTGKTTAEMRTRATFSAWNFSTIWAISEVETVAASSILAKSAILNGTLVFEVANSDYPYLQFQTVSPSNCKFEWGQTPALGYVTAAESKAKGEPFFATLPNLIPNQTYYFRTAATGSPQVYGALLSFITIMSSVAVLTLPATDITEHKATLHGKVINDGGRMGDVRFEWGLTRAYGAVTPWIGGHETGDEFEYDLNNLAEGMGYHFRAHFKHVAPIVNGQDMVFHTLTPVGPITLITEDQLHLLEASI